MKIQINNFQEISDNISLETPIICVIKQVIEYNPENRFAMLLLEDSYENTIVGFMYEHFATQISHPSIKKRLPMSITIIQGQVKKTSNNRILLEIHFAILENMTFINSNILGSHAYCELETYLKNYIGVGGEINENQLWGNIIHDYLANFFTIPNLLQIKSNIKLITQNIISSVQKAIYHNWAYLISLNKEYEGLLKEFQENFLSNEVEFVQKELNFYSKEYKEFEFICEKMIYSKNLGLQGKIDRLVKGLQNQHFSIYETKTGTSNRSSLIFAYYQCMAYATMLKEYYPENLDAIIIEYPRNPPSERLKIQDYNAVDLHKILEMRNEIWSILIGAYQHSDNDYNKIGPFKGCGTCFSKNACEFYCYRNYRTKFCANHPEKCSFYITFEQDAEHRALFNKMNAYFSWFFYLLNQEFNANIALINEIHLPANKRELKGNCIANLILESQVLIWLGRCPECFSNLTNSEKICTNCGSHIDIISGFQNNNDIIRNIGFRKENNQELTSTRLRKGDYVVLTPQEFLPLTSESIPATIKNITTNQIELDLAFEIEKKHPIFNTKFYRIDLTTSNYAINLQKQTLDELIRGSLQSDKEHLRKLRDIVINNYTPKDRNIDKKWLIFKKDSKFDMSQQEAIQKALSEQHLCMIQGPPGTGKTTVIVEIILRTLKYLQDQDDLKKKRNAKKYFHYPILITAYTNKAVDNIISKLLDADSTIRVIRIGNITGIDDARILSHTLESICSTEINLENGQKITTIDPLKANLILKNAQVIATTTTSAGHVVLNQAHFNTVILDEAGQIIEPSALTALIKGERYIIVGDHMQLPPINIGQLEELPKEVEGFTDLLAFKPEQGLGVSIFERLARYYLNTPSYHLLTRQYRMNQVISDFISQFFYQGRLEVGQEKIAKQNLRDLFTDLKMNYESWNDHSKFAMIFNPDTPMVFLDTAKINAEDSHEKIETKDLDSIYNDTEAKIISFFIGLLIEELYQSQKSNFDIVISEIVMQIGVISGYRAQNQRLHQHLQELLEKIVMNWKFNSIAKKEEILEKLHRITIDTVDRFQGGEREIIFYSFVDSNSTYSLRSLNTELRRINVALSRAKKKLIIVGNSKTLKVKTSQDSPVIKEAKLFYQRMIDYIQIHSGYMELDLSLIEQMGI